MTTQEIRIATIRHADATRPIQDHRDRYSAYIEEAHSKASEAQQFQRGEVRRHIVQEAAISLQRARQDRLSWCRFTPSIPG